MKLLKTMIKYYKVNNIYELNKLKDKTILITGASGLIGSNLVAFLSYLNKKNGLNIKIIAVVKSKIESWHEQAKYITYYDLDLSKKNIKPDLSFDYLIHCATYAQPKKFLKHPKETVLLNIKTLFNLLDHCKKNNATFLFLSSAEIYGEPDNKHIPTNENYFGYVNTLSERAIYAESKRLAETICYSYSKHINVKIARILLAYGPGLRYDDQRVIPEFIKRAQNEKKISMMDAGSAYRTFCFISDLIEMLINVMINGKSMTYNLCGKETYSIKETARLIAKINNAELVENNQFQTISGTPTKSILSNKKYLNEFKKNNFVKFYEGLKITSSWFEALKNE